MLTPTNAYGTNDVSIENISVQPYTVKVGDTFTVAATLVNNSTVPIIVDGGKCSVQDRQAGIFTIMLDDHVKIKAKNINCAGVGWSQILDPVKTITGTSPDYTTNYVAAESGTANITVKFSYHAIIQKDPIQTGDEQTISKSFLFDVQNNNTNVIPPSINSPYPTHCCAGPVVTSNMNSPLKQFHSGIKAENVKCGSGFILVINKNHFPACVRLETAVNLVDRGSWLPTIQTVWFVHYSSETTPWLTNVPSDISLNHTEQCVMADSTWKYLKSQGVTPLEILWTWPNLIATPEGVVGQHPVVGFLVHVLPNESSTMTKLGFKERSDVYYPLDLSLMPRLSVCNDSGKAQ